MPPTFKDHFSTAATDYSAYRPDYPKDLFEHLASVAPSKRLAWDCATGSGQAAVALAPYFENVIATDASASQIENAAPFNNVEYRVAAAESSGLEAHSIDLVTVAQSLHWFDIKAFAKEVQRVIRPGGILAVWTYNLLHIAPEIDACVNNFYDNKVGTYWPPERRMVENGYADVCMPFNDDLSPDFEMTKEWNLSHLIGYLETGAAVSAYKKAHGLDPVESISDELAALWGDPMSSKPVIWPLTVRIWLI